MISTVGGVKYILFENFWNWAVVRPSFRGLHNNIFEIRSLERIVGRWSVKTDKKIKKTDDTLIKYRKILNISPGLIEIRKLFYRHKKCFFRPKSSLFCFKT